VMNFKVVILDSAEQDLKELREYILDNFSAEVWRTTYNKFKQSIRTLQKFPLAGSIPEEIKKLNLTQYRQLISGMNRVIYEVRQDVIYIHIVTDVMRDMNAVLINRMLRAN
jgi:plasmid stabilization system protein ParE